VAKNSEKQNGASKRGYATLLKYLPLEGKGINEDRQANN
jgi:hypothetical protein